MRFYFVRHGESEANVLGVISNRGSRHGLTEKGRGQAADLASGLRDSGITRIYSSPLLRALQTTEVLAGALGMDYEVTDALREFDCGIAEGRSDREAWELHRQVMEDWLQRGQLGGRIDEGESFYDIQNRFVPFIQSLLKEQGRADASILVGHGGLYHCMLPLVLANVSHTSVEPFPNGTHVLAEARSAGLVCLEWCGTPIIRSL